MEKKPYYITTAIAYASGKPHIGNTYEIILADSIARFKKLEGYDVRFQTGTDEHGIKVEEKAAIAGQTPKEFVDGVADEIKRIFDLVNCKYDRFIRTTDEDHVVQIQKMFRKLYNQGDIYKNVYEGMYCKPCESFYTSSQLVNGKCPDCGRECTPAKEEAYFFKMSKYADTLINHINTHPEFIQPESRKNEMMKNFLLPGLKDLCVSRTSVKWGIPVDFDPNHTVYVWMDALTNYITGLGFDVDGNHDDLYKKYWPCDLHLIGKDIIRFHTIYWPIFLLALGEPLPKQVFGHPWLLQGGDKMSKSKGNVIYADDMVDLFGVDAVRYFVLHEMPFENDGIITWELLVERINSDLANVLGNLVNRTISMSNKYFGGVVNNAGAAEPVDEELISLAKATKGIVLAKMNDLRVADALTEIFNLYKRCNKYIDETAPWALAKDEAKKSRLETVLYNLVESISIATSLLAPFLPETAERIFAQLNTSARAFESIGEFGLYPSGNKVTAAPEILFARLDLKEILEKVEVIKEKQIAEFNAEQARVAAYNAAHGIVTEASAAGKASADATASASKQTAVNGADENSSDYVPGPGYPDLHVPTKEEISYEDFAKLEFRVGEIIKCEEVKKSKKLLCSQVKIGADVKQIVSGIKAHYSAEEMVGKRVMVVVNLKPATLAGLVSEGMILCAEDENGELALMVPEKPFNGGSEIC